MSLDWNNKKEHKDQILQEVMDKSKWFWTVKFVHASGHGGQHKDHGNSKAQLVFDVEKFFEAFDLGDDRRDKFVEVFGKKKIHHDNTSVMLENQDERSAQRNKENVLHHLRWLLVEFLEEKKDRVATKTPKYEKKKRLDDKKHHSKKKKHREMPELE